MDPMEPTFQRATRIRATIEHCPKAPNSLSPKGAKSSEKRPLVQAPRLIPGRNHGFGLGDVSGRRGRGGFQFQGGRRPCLRRHRPFVLGLGRSELTCNVWGSKVKGIMTYEP